MAISYSMRGLIRLEPRWREVLGETMPQGFGIGPEAYPVLEECLDKRSQEPLDDYLRELYADGRLY